MAPYRRVIDVPSQQARDGRGGAERDVHAAVVAAGEAGLALPADDIGFHGHAVAELVRGDGGVFGNDDAGGFVAEDVRVGYDHGADAAGVPEVDVGAVMTLQRGRGLGECACSTYPQMPVLLMAIVTSPGCRLSPFSTSSLLGDASPTHRSCAGLV